MNYVVRAGDTLNSIAARFGVPVQELIRVNNIAYPYYIYVGQTIYIPTVTTPAPTPPPMSDFDRRLTRAEYRIDALRDDYTKLNDRVDRLETRINRLETRVTNLERPVATPPPPRPRPTTTPTPRPRQ
ncbi:LysM peptidoglycan-binding domain-containing protein [Brevibacillus choshinensis]|uniref:LysM peptidoglycan-binding domain-containing protein n=1 Tax=Brevibacillus choshinensis TaxID=54911 RepID=UPI002E1ADCF4|nr:LysM peptidoglycan-binding domain-containing protein [Brevibacillus choshinensis]MED4751339.1 LysM peptidoglycan-binding domain-containing protein [Brevibacillus choshinensis]MED4783522.1 LysM peptidoglycan-binding domain-containing protein [Brevibacillus choshinensis]